MEEVLNEQSLDEHIWSILACSENAHDLLHYVHHAQNPQRARTATIAFNASTTGASLAVQSVLGL